jgi:hypothetical protein
MNPHLTHLVAEQHATDLRGAADHERIASDLIRGEHESGRRNRIGRLTVRLKRLASRPTATGRPAGRSDVGRDRPVTIRYATIGDLTSIWEVAQLDSQGPPSGPSLVAEIGNEIVAAFAIDTDTVIANPFKPTADAVALLRLRAEQLTSPLTPSRTALGRLRPRNAAAEA